MIKINKLLTIAAIFAAGVCVSSSFPINPQVPSEEIDSKATTTKALTPQADEKLYLNNFYRSIDFLWQEKVNTDSCKLFPAGMITAKFYLHADGTVSDLLIINEKTDSNALLVASAIYSITCAGKSPKPFPQGMRTKYGDGFWNYINFKICEDGEKREPDAPNFLTFSYFKKSEETKYKLKILRTIGSRWYLNAAKAFTQTSYNGNIKVRFYVHSDGTIDPPEITTEDDGSASELIITIRRTIKEVSKTIDPFPPNVKEKYGEGFWEEFAINVGDLKKNAKQ